MKLLRITQKSIAYIIPAALYTLWQSCIGWLNTYWTLEKLGNEFTTINFVLFFLSHALGTVLWAVWLDKGPKRSHISAAAFISAGFTALMTCMMISMTNWGLSLSGILAGLSAGFFTAYFSLFIFIGIPARNRGLTLGLSAATGVTLHFIVFTLALPQTSGIMLTVKTILAAFVILMAGILTVILPICKNNLWPENIHEASLSAVRENIGDIKVRPRLLPVFLFILFCFFMSFGMQDFAATSYWMDGEGVLVYTRLFIIAGYLIGGIAWDLNRRHFLLNSCFALLAMGLVCMAFNYRGAASFIGYASVQLAGAFFSLVVRLIFADLSKFSKRIALFCSLGLVIPFVLKQVGILLSWILYLQFGGIAIFLGALLFIIISMPFVSTLFEKIRSANVASIISNVPIQKPEELAADIPETAGTPETTATPETAATPASTDITGLIAARYGLTKRERQVLELSLHGQAIPEMAQALNLSEPTVKHYIRQILTKTGAKNQRQLLSMLIQEYAI